MTRKPLSKLSFAALMLATPVAISPILTVPAHAWGIVYDPSNYAQNVIQAARALEQINNQITSLQNEAGIDVAGEDLEEAVDDAGAAHGSNAPPSPA